MTDFPRWLNPKLSIKEIEKCYKDEIDAIDERAKRRKANEHIKVPWSPWAYYCVAFTDYTKQQWQTNQKH